MDTIRFRRIESASFALATDSLLPSAVVATVGSFDGLHRGHRFLLEQLKREAQEAGLPTMVVTFDKHPIATLFPDRPYDLLNDDQEKESLLASLGIDFLVVLPFDKAFSKLTTQDFFNEVLVDLLGTKVLVNGYDNRFGKREKASDPTNSIKALSQARGVKFVQALPAYNPQGREYSSTLIREALRQGRIYEAGELLGYPYSISGVVVDGSKLGRTLGYPTANIEVSNRHKLIPPAGVYAASIAIKDDTASDSLKQGMLYIGNRPTLGSHLESRVEVYLFDFNGDLYGKHLTLHLHQEIRGDVRFDNLEDLVAQLRLDEATIRKYFHRQAQEA